jgi:hypothetical protein
MTSESPHADPADEYAETPIPHEGGASADTSATLEPPPVEQQREEVAATVDALLGKADVAGRAKDAARRQKETIEQNWRPLAAGAAAAAVVLGTVVMLRRRGK